MWHEKYGEAVTAGVSSVGSFVTSRPWRTVAAVAAVGLVVVACGPGEKVVADVGAHVVATVVEAVTEQLQADGHYVSVEAGHSVTVLCD